jgi:peptidoglycan hydrolase-like protein with peptidoglycan-binding domain
VPLHVRAVTPSHRLHAHSAVTVRFSATLASASVTPTITPAIPGTWRITANTSTFTPAIAYAPDTAYTVTVPAGSLGVSASTGGRLHRARHVTLHTGTPSVMDAEQILARLRYLPLRTTAPRPRTAAAAADAVYHPLAGHFTWRWRSIPQALRDLWAPGKPNSLLQGAILAFQHAAGLTADELLGPSTWRALLAADRAHRVDRNPYSYIYADLSTRPQTLTLWRAGGTVLTSPTNGGVAGAPTPDGTFPIYERLASTTMSGTNPDGSHYSDPGVPWVNYFNGGSAVHGFPRASYGSPQSVGCLELPIPTADRVFGLVNYGTLVTVTG